MAKGSVQCEIYQQSLVGKALQEVLNNHVLDGTLDPNHALDMMALFDKAIIKALRQQKYTELILGGKLKMYNHSNDVWRGDLEDVHLVFQNTDLIKDIETLKLVAVDANIFPSEDGDEDGGDGGGGGGGDQTDNKRRKRKKFVRRGGGGSSPKTNAT
eukprot:Gb_26240 [translate_table: standard]